MAKRKKHIHHNPDTGTSASIRMFADQAFSRAAGAPLISGNSVGLLKDAAENYPAWLEAINSAQHTINFESYIIHADKVGNQFADALSQKAREGVTVRLIYDWMGGLGYASGGFWQRMRDAGVTIICFNPPRFDSPFGWLTRDHRKVITVDGNVAFVNGLCVGQSWVGDPERGIEPWRDTGVVLRGPAVADVESAFAQAWEAGGGTPIPQDELPAHESLKAAGEVTLRVIASRPNTAGLYRLDHLVAALARRSLWLTDAYFAGTTTYVQSLRAAARDGVDVRLLVPGASDTPFMPSISRAGYRPLLEAGVRVFEWNGSMLHAKTAVADGQWARVGSTNLNLASWIGNWELDVAVEDHSFARQMEEMYLEDLERSTEIVLSARNRVRPSTPRPRRHRKHGQRGSVGRVAAGAISISSAVGAAVTNHRVLGPAEATVMTGAGLLLLALTVLALVVPRAITIPLAIIGGWTALALLMRAYKLSAQKEDAAALETASEEKRIKAAKDGSGAEEISAVGKPHSPAQASKARP
jgi:cardiolipin synthase